MYRSGREFGDIVRVPCDDNMLAIGQGLLKALQGLSAHDDLMARGQGLETFEIVRQMPDQIVVLPQGIVLPSGRDQDQSLHGSFFLLMPERGNSVSISFWISAIRCLCRATKRSLCPRSQVGPMNLWVTKTLKKWIARRKPQPKMAHRAQS